MRKSSFVSSVLAVILLAIAVPAAAANRWVKVINESSRDVWYIYGTNAGDTGWGRDRLGDQVLHSGYNIKINFDDGSNACIFDLKAESKYGTSWVKRGINVCSTETWTLTD